MSLLGDMARENMIKEIREIIEDKISQNKGNPEIVKVLGETYEDILRLLPYRVDLPLRKEEHSEGRSD